MSRREVTTITINSTHRIRKTSVQSEPSLTAVNRVRSTSTKSRSSSGIATGGERKTLAVRSSESCRERQHSQSAELKCSAAKKAAQEKEKLAKLKRDYKEDISKAKRAKYNSASVSAGRVLKDLKNSATKGLTTFKTSFENLLSLKLRLLSPKDAHHRSEYGNCCANYNELENDEPRTPVKLYSPFNFESPALTERTRRLPLRRYRGNMKTSQSINGDMVFASPTGKIKDDIRSVTNSLNELCLISNDIQYRFSLTNSYSNFSITTQ